MKKLWSQLFGGLRVFYRRFFNKRYISNQRQGIWKESTRRKMWLHLDNAKVHNSKLTSGKYDILGFKRAPHPAYSPDIAPSDFYLFGFLEEKLKEKKIQ